MALPQGESHATRACTTIQTRLFLNASSQPMANWTWTCATPPRFRLDMGGGTSIPILPLPFGLFRKLIATGNRIRICPGRHYAASVLFMVAATVLHTLSITAPLGKDAKPIRLEGKMSYGLLSCVADSILRRCRHIH